jgi:DNA-directed RNA polymerase II subunit RPB9
VLLSATLFPCLTTCDLVPFEPSSRLRDNTDDNTRTHKYPTTRHHTRCHLRPQDMEARRRRRRFSSASARSGESPRRGAGRVTDTSSSNLLFPREDKSENKLLFACRTCSFTEEAPSSCVMRHEISSTVGATAGVTAEVAQDPTVGLFHSSSRASDPEELPCCTMCGMDIVCVECGEDHAPGFVLEAEDEPAAGSRETEHEEYGYEDDISDDDMDDDSS